MAANRVARDAEVLEVLAISSRRRGPSAFLDPAPLHPFPARLPLRYAEYLVERLTAQQATVLDPMVGSGTVITAARKLGRRGIGFDRDPLALLIARTGTADFVSNNLLRVGTRIFARAKEISQSGIGLPMLRAMLPDEDQEFVRYWFPARAQQQLFALAEAIRVEGSSSEADFAWVVFSKLIIAKTAGASFAMDIARSRPHKRGDKPVVLPFDAWNSRFAATLKRLPFVDKSCALTPALVGEADARELPLEDSAVDLVLTSPPYRNAIDYMRGHRFSLIWMGRQLEELRELRGRLVGTDRGLWTRDGLPRGFERRLDRTVLLDARRAKIRRYLSDLKKILAEIQRVLRPGGLGIVIVGPTILSNSRTDAHLIVAQLAEPLGLTLIGSARRPLVGVRRALPPPSITCEHLAKRAAVASIVPADTFEREVKAILDPPLETPSTIDRHFARHPVTWKDHHPTHGVGQTQELVTFRGRNLFEDARQRALTPEGRDDGVAGGLLQRSR